MIPEDMVVHRLTGDAPREAYWTNVEFKEMGSIKCNR